MDSAFPDEQDYDLCKSLQQHSSLRDLWVNQCLCDVKLYATNMSVIPAHKVVLASVSGYFRALFAGAGTGMLEGAACDSSTYVQMDLDYSSLLEVITSVYEGRIRIQPATLAATLATSSYLAIMPLVESCCEYMQRRISLATVVDFLNMAAHHNCAQLQRDTMKYLCARFSDLMSSPEQPTICRLPLGLMLDVLHNDDLDADGELDVLRAAVLWVAADTEERQAHLPELLTAVRHEALGAATLAEIPALLRSLGCPGLLGQVLAVLQPAAPSQPTTTPATATVGPDARASPATPASASGQDATTTAPAPAANNMGMSWRGAASVASSSTAGGVHVEGREGGAETSARVRSDQLAGPMGRSQRSRRYIATGLLVAGGHDASWRSLKCTEVYSPLQDRWEPGPTMPKPLSFCAAALLEREVYVVGGSMFTPEVLRYDARTCVWSEVRWEDTARVHCGVASLGGCLYVVGGRSQQPRVLSSTVFFSPQHNAWRAAGDTLLPRYAHGCASLGGAVYAVGGQEERAIHRSAEVFDPGRGQWSMLQAQLSSERKYTGAATLNGRLYVVGGVDDMRTRLDSVEAYDPREGRWSLLPSMQVPRSSCGVAVLQDRLYVVGGNVGDEHTGDSVECYEPAAGTWRACASLGCPRSGLSVCPV